MRPCLKNQNKKKLNKKVYVFTRIFQNVGKGVQQIIPSKASGHTVGCACDSFIRLFVIYFDRTGA
jgi:hypothetical protein